MSTHQRPIKTEKDRIDPQELFIPVHHLNKGRICHRSIVLGEDHLTAHIVDISALAHFHGRIRLIGHRQEGNVRRQLLGGIIDPGVLHLTLKDDLIYHIMPADALHQLREAGIGLVGIDVAAALQHLEDLIQRGDGQAVGGNALLLNFRVGHLTQVTGLVKHGHFCAGMEIIKLSFR